MMRVGRDWEGGRGKNRYEVMWEGGVVIGLVFENMWSEGDGDRIYWICMGMCVVVVVMYELLRDGWY